VRTTRGCCNLPGAILELCELVHKLDFDITYRGSSVLVASLTIENLHFTPARCYWVEYYPADARNPPCDTPRFCDSDRGWGQATHSVLQFRLACDPAGATYVLDPTAGQFDLKGDDGGVVVAADRYEYLHLLNSGDAAFDTGEEGALGKLEPEAVWLMTKNIETQRVVRLVLEDLDGFACMRCGCPLPGGQASASEERFCSMACSALEGVCPWPPRGGKGSRCPCPNGLCTPALAELAWRLCVTRRPDSRGACQVHPTQAKDLLRYFEKREAISPNSSFAFARTSCAECSGSSALGCWGYAGTPFEGMWFCKQCWQLWDGEHAVHEASP